MATQGPVLKAARTFSGWLSSCLWAIGTLVGVYLLLTGITRLMVGLTGRRLIRPQAHPAAGSPAAGSPAAGSSGMRPPE